MKTEKQNGGNREDVCPSKKGKLDLASVRAEIDKASGPEYWRSLEELAGSPDFQEALHREFPKGASEWVESVSRRGFLKVMGASMALAGMTGCVKLPKEEIVPYVRQPEEVIPGRPMFYATAMTLGGYASPLLVESHLGRPTKIEGNDRHPASLGGTDIFAQAHILGLYDPDRSQSVTELGDQRSWQSFVAAIRGPLMAQKNLQGAGIRVLTPTISSPTLADQLRNFLKIYPQAKWHVYEPVNRDNVLEGAKLAFGQPVETRYDFSKADVIVSLDADFLYAGFPGNVRYIRDFAARRNPDGNMNRLYVIESGMSSTGAKADHRVGVKALGIPRYAGLLLNGGHSLDVVAGNTGLTNEQFRFMSTLGKDLQDRRGTSVVVAGDHQAAEVHALAHVLNDKLGNVGKTVFYTDSVDANPVSQVDSLKDLVADMQAGKVDLLLILGGNPAYDAQADLQFAELLKSNKSPLRVHLGLYQNETADLCQWHVAQAHELESWGDARAYDGTASIIQPLIAPLYGGKTASEFVALLSGQPDSTSYDLVREYWQKQHTGSDFEAFWRKSLHDGWIEGTAFAEKSPKLATPPEVSNKPLGSRDLKTLVPLVADPNAIELNIRRDPTIYDGQFSNNGWLQELPKPMTKLTWDNAILIGPKMAERLQIASKDVVELTLNGVGDQKKTVTGAAWIQAGLPDNSVTVTLGYGRKRAGRVGTGYGFDAYQLRTSAAPWFTSGVQIRKTGAVYELASVQGMQSMETPNGDTRPLVREATLEEYRKEPNFAQEEEPAPGLTLYKPYPYKEEAYAWGMAIDLNKCVGCNNCVIACQSENNIAVVGQEQAHLGRHMHWIRIDAYYQGDRENPKAYFQPVPCMQCENAPCEVVCPVGATNHSSEGLNDMVYNRCVGTRYCSNNCPYKVRRFNFLLFQDWTTEQYKMMRNPDVSVRSRGVMEKCTYCVQRINEHKIDAETASVREGKEIKVGDELQTACQQSCPAEAIVFGNINDPNSKVSKVKALSRNYSLLGELNTRPRTTYLAEVTNPNPELKS
jgi:molybdopterin-containing oxidoreductase family iron-sulfur binding subunit